MIDEQFILSSVNHKNVKAWKSLYTHFYSALCSYTHQILKDKSEVEDVVQEVFINMWNADKQFESIQQLTSYLYRSCYNNALVCLRNNHLHDTILNKIGEETDHYEDNLYELTLRQEVLRQLYLHINSLPQEQKKVVILSIEGYSREEIAEKLGVTVNTVKTHKSRAFKALKAQLKDNICIFLI